MAAPLNDRQKTWTAVGVAAFALGAVMTLWLGDWRGVVTGLVAALVALVFAALSA